jgi:hypothetical protein
VAGRELFFTLFSELEFVRRGVWEILKIDFSTV